MKVASKYRCIASPAIRDVVNRVQLMEEAGAKVSHLEIGRPDFDTPHPIKAATIAALERGEVHYGPSAGLLALREAVADEMSERRGVCWDAGSVIITNGAVEALFASLMAVIEQGDEVLLLQPCWTAYPAIVQLLGGVPVYAPLRHEMGFRPDVAACRNAISAKTVAMILNSPQNPTGAVFGRVELEELAALAVEHDLAVFSDEVYDHIVYDGVEALSIASLPGMQERTAVVGAFSKTYSMTGWRIGFIALPESHTRPTLLNHIHMVTSVNTFVQYGALEALHSGARDADSMRTEYQRRRDVVFARFARMPEVTCHLPEGGFFLFPRFEGFSDDVVLARRLLEEANVATVPGSAFGQGGEGHLRLSLSGSPSDVLEGLDSIESWLQHQRQSKESHAASQR